ncbi:MAG TPA: ABC transporter substrate-binding protein [Verrucomicrobiae bacterium]|jgi:phospholipid transport system substrate-binding protein|nr:ABC transporter substrate-binding protein [Verrucomicrobiae bacterium]
MSRYYAVIAAALAVLFFLDAPRQAAAGLPTDQVRATVESITAILKNPALKSDAKRKDRREQLRRAIFSRFDFNEMAARSLGSYWRKLTPQQQDEFTRLFTDLLEAAYLEQIESYTNERFVYVKETIDQDYAEVQSRIQTAKGEEYALNYRLRLVGKEWKIYDVVIENISLVNNYRSQFNRVIANQSYDELLRKLKDKQVQTATDRR